MAFIAWGAAGEPAAPPFKIPGYSLKINHISLQISMNQNGGSKKNQPCPVYQAAESVLLLLRNAFFRGISQSLYQTECLKNKNSPCKKIYQEAAVRIYGQRVNQIENTQEIILFFFVDEKAH
ncbi:hypothetical protein LK436_17700 [Clostridium sp. M62/1]|uniref:hypothetical protein n=1 Tax=Clostridium sp. M62/1 TaxID=411486 RepID=UPI00019738B7|nr:hypothetical protein [Clostridium sp. M62/1]EFE10980.1 hypothetical protein CLOM621_08758 [Clostridium sp. M62/1]UEB78666.1 hypothetical protein LK436_17700 [Clostridium sp. M62/1]